MKKKVIIQEKVFHRLWETALQEKDANTLSLKVLHSKEYKTLASNGLEMEMFYELIKAIFETAHISIMELMNRYHIKTSVLSHRLCIPQKTIEHWKYGDRECPPYMKLIILKEFRMKWLPEYIIVGENDERKTKKTSEGLERATLENRTKSTCHDRQNNRLLSVPDNTGSADNEVCTRDNSLKEDKESYAEKHSRLWSLKEYEQAHVYNENQTLRTLINSTSYIDEILKKKKQGGTTS